MCNCDWLNNVFGHTGTTPSGTTAVTTAETSAQTETPVVIDDDQIQEPDPIEVKMDRLEVEKAIIEYAMAPTRKITDIAVHCTATPEGREVTMDELDAWHKARGFKKQKISGHYCGYHYVVALDGTIMCGRDLREIGAHVQGYNSISVGVCYVGGLDKNYKEKDTRTPEQKETLNWLIGELKHRLNVTKVQGHRDYSPDTNNNGVIEEFEWIKSCPCFDAIPEYKDI